MGQPVRPRLARRVRGRRVDRIVLGEIALVAAAVDLIRRDVDEDLDLRRRPERLEEHVRAVDVRQHELARVDDAPVDVRLGREVDDGLRPGRQGPRELPVADVPPHELVARIAVDVLQVVEVSRVGELVQVDDADAGNPAEEEADEMAADESRASGHEDRLPGERPFRHRRLSRPAAPSRRGWSRRAGPGVARPAACDRRAPSAR